MERKELENKLNSRFFVVGGGAWQALWEPQDDVKPAMGFLPAPPADEVDPSAKDLKSSMRSELLKRFRSQVLVMQPMTKSDYQLLIPQFASCLPAMRQECFTTLANEGIETAVKEQLGMRYFEEILTQAICSYMTSKTP